MKRSILGLAAGAILMTALSGCKGGWDKTSSGLSHKIHSTKNGRKAQTGDLIKFNMIIMTDKDSVLESTYKPSPIGPPHPIETEMMKPRTVLDLMEGFQMMGPGDSASFRVNSDSLFKGPMPRPAFIKEHSYIVYHVKMVDVMTKEMMDKKEQSEMQGYIQSKGLKYETTPSGLMYIIEKQGEGIQPKIGDTVSVTYSGTLLNGTKFDASADHPGQKPFKFILGQHMVIPGWDEGIMLLKEGGKAKLLLPSRLAYGNKSMGQAIPAHSPLAFDVELVKVIPAANAAPLPGNNPAAQMETKGNNSASKMEQK